MVASVRRLLFPSGFSRCILWCLLVLIAGFVVDYPVPASPSGGGQTRTARKLGTLYAARPCFSACYRPGPRGSPNCVLNLEVTPLAGMRRRRTASFATLAIVSSPADLPAGRRCSNPSLGDLWSDRCGKSAVDADIIANRRRDHFRESNDPLHRCRGLDYANVVTSTLCFLFLALWIL